MSTVALLIEDVASTRAWVRSVLRGLAADNENAARLRETVQVYLASNLSNVAAAKQIDLHYNSVKYRVKRAAEERGRRLHRGSPRRRARPARVPMAGTCGRDAGSGEGASRRSKEWVGGKGGVGDRPRRIIGIAHRVLEGDVVAEGQSGCRQEGCVQSIQHRSSVRVRRGVGRAPAPQDRCGAGKRCRVGESSLKSYWCGARAGLRAGTDEDDVARHARSARKCSSRRDDA